jgi:hypothetical protein
MMNIKSRTTLTRLVGAGQGRHKRLTTSASSIASIVVNQSAEAG